MVELVPSTILEAEGVGSIPGTGAYIVVQITT